jgi:hypothetical protein
MTTLPLARRGVARLDPGEGVGDPAPFTVFPGSATFAVSRCLLWTLVGVGVWVGVWRG